MGPQIHLAETVDLLEKQRKDNAKKRKREAKRNRKLQKRQLRVEIVVKEHEEQLVRRRTRQLLWRSFLETTAQTDLSSLKWLTLENMHNAIRDTWPNPAFKDTVRQIHDLPLHSSPDRFMEIATLVSPRLLLQMQSLKSQGSPYAYQVAEIFLRLKYTLPAPIPDTALGKLKRGQAILKDPLLLELNLKETESIQDVYLRVRDYFCRHEIPSAIFAKGVQHDEILQLFQGLARIHCPHLEDVQDPLGGAHYLGFSKMRIPSLESTDESDHDEDGGTNAKSTKKKGSAITGQKDLAKSSSANQADINLLLLLVEILVFGLILYALVSNFG